MPPSPSPMDISGCAPSELCDAFSDVLLDVKDVDADDYNNPMLCSEYVKEIYKYLRQLEVRFVYLGGGTGSEGRAGVCQMPRCLTSGLGWLYLGHYIC